MTDQKRWKEIEDLFQTLCPKSDEERAKILDQIALRDPQLRWEVESILSHHAEPDSVLDGENRTFSRLLKTSKDISTDPAHSILHTKVQAGYEVHDLVGSGGMGLVYKARQQSTNRIVALKVLRLELASDSTVRRFDSEVRTLAQLQHPHIAQIYEAGTLEIANGERLPFFAMEFIPDAVTISTWVQKERLDWRSILTLILDASDAVAHGHAKGIIHRDIKPSNLLVDESGELKVIDFGVAKSLDNPEEATAGTRTGQVVGTVRYMSPEQGDGELVDERSDVYSLGVVLYELLCGKLPYEVSTTNFTAALSNLRSSPVKDPSKFNPVVRGDLRTVLLHALEKNPGFRYPSIVAFSEDLRRVLAGTAIAARKPGYVERTVHFSRRNPILSLALSLTFIALAAGSVLSSIGLRQAKAATREASDRANDALQMLTFLESLFASPDPGRDGPEVKVVDFLARAEEMLPGAFEDPKLEARMSLTLAETYFRLSTVEKAEVQYRRSLALFESIGDADSTQEVRYLFARFLTSIKPTEAYDLLFQVRQRDIETLGQDHPRVFDITSMIGRCQRLLGGMDEEAEANLIEAVEGLRKSQVATECEKADAIEGLGVFYRSRFDYEKAIPLLEEALQLYLSESVEGDAIAQNYRNELALCYKQAGRLDDAEEVYREALKWEEAVSGEAHTDTLRLKNNMAQLKSTRGKHDEAATMLEEAYQLSAKRLGENARLTLIMLDNRGLIEFRRGNPERGEEFCLRALNGFVETAGEASESVATSLHTILMQLCMAGQGQRAIELAETHLPAFDDDPSAWPYRLPQCYGQYGVALWMEGLVDESEEALVIALHYSEEWFGRGSDTQELVIEMMKKILGEKRGKEVLSREGWDVTGER